MGYYWAATPEPPEDVAEATGLLVEFDEQADAESWLTASYENLTEVGIHAVSLYEGDRLVYGPMSLDA